ncbi:MAG: type II secretion system F family protein [Rhodospirillales bacterium]|jgi:tight adherence protein B|nr:type II secretion system F family protein [Rhodospirillales bacterium]
MSPDTLIVFGGALASLVCLFLILGGKPKQARGPLAKRARDIKARTINGGSKDSQENTNQTSVKRQEARSIVPGLDVIARRLLPRQAVLRQRLEKTGRSIGVGSYVALNVAVLLVVAGALLFLVRIPVVLSVAIGVVVGVGLPHFVVGRMVQGRLDKFAGLFPEAIDLMVRGLRSGLPVTESISVVGHELPDPVGTEFRKISDKVQFGRPLDEALWETAKRLDTPDFKFFVISLAVQRETGGNLAETLANLSDILRRRQMKLKIKAMSSEARASAYILGSLPFIMFGLIYLLNPGYETELFTDPRGRVMLIGGLTTMSMGIAVMRKMVRFEI